MKHTASAKKKSNGKGTSTKASAPPRFAVCIDNSNYAASLEQNKIYRVLPDRDAFKDGDLRIVDESGEDYLYSAKRFVPIDVPRKVAASLNKPK